ncbi:phosphonate ABC transporter [Acidovorax sp. SRB_14]|uniref:phosphonate ABC transporter ATP-binding protein n=1 Tax=unclassified Acidovorax TaxID=2684926 RepID=UPI00145CB13C|nr:MULTISPECIES: ATP-binding cassette domain-containing protein [unclassified Acidovorax]NMM75812.1 phosphonate ABC transporter [Acidovorax sp. SRB_24]NMM81822.1 phosphonate ABC transporter [Acidovorax sp. SRB_14]
MNLRLHNATVRHPAARAGAPAALQGLDLAVAQGEQMAVIGPSGAGKTTLLHLLACAQRPAEGSVHFDGSDPWALSRRALQRLRGRLFLAPQVPPLPPRQRVVTAVLAGRLPHESLWASVRSLVHPTGTALAEHALAHFDVADKLFDRVDRLSGGERQRVGLARALATQASLFLVDEPLSALDPARAQQALASLTQAARERGATLVATLHHVDMALHHFPRVIGLRGGTLAFDLPAAQVTPDHLHQLYAQHLDELADTTPPAPDGPMAAAPVPMQCR